jgi:hypothetical protein
VVLLLLVLGVQLTRAQQPPSAKPTSDAVERVSEIRRTIRRACEDLKTAQFDTTRKAELLAEALTTTQAGEELWLAFISDTGALHASPYGTHPHWQDSTKLISEGMVKMQDLIKVGDAEQAVKSCGANCGRFVRLNQVAGVYRTSDLLFQIRMTVRKLETAVQNAQFGEIRAALSGMLSLRDKAIADIVGGTGSEEVKKERLGVFSKALDDFNKAAVAEDSEALTKTYQELLKSWDQAYSLLL